MADHIERSAAGRKATGPTRSAARPGPRDRKAGRARRRGPMKATPESLEKAAHAYLSRFAASAAHLRRLLIAKVERSARFHGTESAAGAAAVDGLIARLQRGGLLDDAAYAAARARSLHRRGASAQGIRGQLRARGIERDLVEQSLAALAAEAAEPELAAALAFARRRRLGPYRATAERADRRDRDLAALGRQGFDLGLAIKVIDARDPAELEREASGD